jgi:hypothetical protein
MKLLHPASLSVAVLLLAASPAAAQRFPFEHTVSIAGPVTVEIVTDRGRIEVTEGAPGRVAVAGAVTVRVGFTVPANAIELARRVAAQPPIERTGDTIRLTDPAGAAERRAVTVNYVVQVPAGTTVRTRSDSGATTVRDVSGAVDIRTQSGAIDVRDLGAGALVTTGSGSVDIAGVRGDLSVTTSSSAISLQGIGGPLRVRTGSGAVDAGMAGDGAVDIETRSSAVRVGDATGALAVRTGSGAVHLRGNPAREAWEVSTGSGSIDLRVPPAAAFRLDAQTTSGSVDLTGASITGSAGKRTVTGTIGGGGSGGGALVHARSRSGSVRITVADDSARR